MNEVGAWCLLVCYVAVVAMISLLMIQVLFLAFVAIQTEGKFPACEQYLEEELLPDNLEWHDQQLKKFFISVYFPIFSPDARIRIHTLLKNLMLLFRRWPAIAYVIALGVVIALLLG